MNDTLARGESLLPVRPSGNTCKSFELAVDFRWNPSLPTTTVWADITTSLPPVVATAVPLPGRLGTLFNRRAVLFVLPSVSDELLLSSNMAVASEPPSCSFAICKNFDAIVLAYLSFVNDVDCDVADVVAVVAAVVAVAVADASVKIGTDVVVVIVIEVEGSDDDTVAADNDGDDDGDDTLVDFND